MGHCSLRADLALGTHPRPYRSEANLNLNLNLGETGRLHKREARLQKLEPRTAAFCTLASGT